MPSGWPLPRGFPGPLSPWVQDQGGPDGIRRDWELWKVGKTGGGDGNRARLGRILPANLARVPLAGPGQGHSANVPAAPTPPRRFIPQLNPGLVACCLLLASLALPAGLTSWSSSRR